MEPLIQNIGVKNTEQLISLAIYFSRLQFQKNIQPTIPKPSWKPPKSSETDYKQPDETGIVPLQLSYVPNIDWNLINWDLLDELTKDEIRHKMEMSR